MKGFFLEAFHFSKLPNLNLVLFSIGFLIP